MHSLVYVLQFSMYSTRINVCATVSVTQLRWSNIVPTMLVSAWLRLWALDYAFEPLATLMSARLRV